MGSSAKKKREKKKDFQKTKLKVGKTAPKASNVTDTSFKSKSIVLNQQSLKTSAPSQLARFTHHLSLLSSHSDSQCRESLAYLTTASAVPAAKVSQPPWAVIIPKLLPLMTRTSSSLRTQLLKLFQQIPADDVRNHVELFTIYIRAGMTSLAAEIRADAFEILRWLLDTAGGEVVSCAGGWTKILKSFVAVFAWDNKKGGTNDAFQQLTSMGRAAASGEKSVARQLQIFGLFLRHGVGVPKGSDRLLALQRAAAAAAFPLRNANQHLLPRRPNCFAYLNLFGLSHDDDDDDGESDICEDQSDRLKVLEKYRQSIDRGLTSAQKQGGELGRVAVQVRQVWQDV
ncbi:MAG: rRNA processing protein [Peltula sp. TS41687]|nr:MAG: rRNA processing protein [Peltula sp. TS41687]